MGFTAKDVDKALISCARCCCVCHKFCGTKIELHHIIPEAEGGLDTFENCIPLCFECHAEVGHYNPKHPRGRRFTESELHGHRDAWYLKIVSSGSVVATSEHREMDRIIFSLIRQRFSNTDHGYDTVYLLRDMDFGGHIDIDGLKGLYSFTHFCETPESEFMDAELESQRAGLVAATRELLGEIGIHTFPVAGTSERINEVPPEWRDSNLTRYENIRSKLNQLATTVYHRYENLVRTGRRRLAVS